MELAIVRREITGAGIEILCSQFCTDVVCSKLLPSLLRKIMHETVSLSKTIINNNMTCCEQLVSFTSQTNSIHYECNCS